MESKPMGITSLSLTDLPNGMIDAVEIPTGDAFWHRYATAYKEAADRLAATMVADTSARYFLGPPMMFLYRHYVELHLKSLLRDAGEFLDSPETVPAKHYLWVLWEHVRKLLLTIDGGSNGPWFTRADCIIKVLDELDPTSFAFRYPVTKYGEPTLPNDLFVEPEIVAQVMGELDVLLNGASTQIDIYQGQKHEGI